MDKRTIIILLAFFNIVLMCIDGYLLIKDRAFRKTEPSETVEDTLECETPQDTTLVMEAHGDLLRFHTPVFQFIHRPGFRLEGSAKLPKFDTDLHPLKHKLFNFHAK